VNPKVGILYIFYDDNQALLPFRTKFPIDNAPFSLSKNCRNAGKVYEVVRKFHPQAPETELFLKHSGVYEKTVFKSGNEEKAIANVIISTLSKFSQKDVIILTTEADPSSNSVLNGLTIEIPTKYQWQDAVHKYLEVLLSHYRFYRDKILSERFEIKAKPQLSDHIFPTTNDINMIKEYVKSFTTRPVDDKAARPTKKLKWLKTSNNLYLGKASFYSLKDFFITENWIKTLPRPTIAKITAASTLDKNAPPNTIRLLTVSSFKGLEAESIILFSRDFNDNLNANLYVGISRAKFYLHVVVSNEVDSRLKIL